MKSIIFTVLIVALLLPWTAFGQSNGKEVYEKACASCHKSGVAGAPVLGDKKAWEPHIAKGMDHMYASAINGKGSMPAKGGHKSLTDDEVKAAVDYLVEESK
ncbi:MAG TPA: c-type cytochrome [Geopsychrobacteraceae bacterium]|nr:c-type cytochrome [Geopsychrobacteraceae bacterium]